MRTTLRWTFLGAALAPLLACSSPEEMAAGVNDGEGETSAETLDRRTAAGFDAMDFADEDKRGEAARDFSFSWPAQVSAIPPLARMLKQELERQLSQQQREWEASVAEFGDGTGEGSCVSCVNRSFSKQWAVVADTPRFLVLAGETYTYTGGAHGNTGYEGLVWDREAQDGKGEAMGPEGFFTAPTALENAAKGAYCEALNQARREKRGGEGLPTDMFDNCPTIDELVVLPKSSDGEHFDQITFIAAPYVAGSYAEGTYEFTIPVTDAILDVVKAQYRDAFVAK